MRKLIVEEWISLDGFAEDQNGKLDYFPSATENRYADERQLKFLETIDTILFGRKTYELFVEYWPTASVKEEIIADKLNEIPNVVLSNTLKKAPWGKWAEAEVISGDALDAVRKLKSENKKDIILWGSLSLTQALMKAGLVDELRIQLCPTVVGGGRSFFPEGEEYKQWKLIEQKSLPTGIVYIHYGK